VRRPLPVIAAAGALLFCYAGVLRGMFHQWLTDEDMAHGLLVPFVMFWIVWRERSRWRELPLAPSRWAVVVLGAGAGLQLASAAGAGLFVGSVALLVSIAGVVLGLGGMAWLRCFAFPLGLGLFALPKLAFVYIEATQPLQLWSTRIAAAILSASGSAVIRRGNILEVSGRQIAVVEACSGLRYLIPLGFLALLFAYLSGSRGWVRAALPAAALPVAIIFNALRLAAMASSPALMIGALHDVSGLAVFLLGLASIVSVHRLLVVLTRGSHG
jgi:exosortase